MSVSFDKALTHQNGLAVSRPAGFAEVIDERGFAFSETGDRRAPRTMRISVAHAQPALPQAEERVFVDGTPAKFMTRELGSGSGGVEYQLTAAKPSDERWIVLTAVEQSETGVPAFETAWQLVEESTLSPGP